MSGGAGRGPAPLAILLLERIPWAPGGGEGWTLSVFIFTFLCPLHSLPRSIYYFILETVDRGYLDKGNKPLVPLLCFSALKGKT